MYLYEIKVFFKKYNLKERVVLSKDSVLRYQVRPYDFHDAENAQNLGIQL